MKKTIIAVLAAALITALFISCNVPEEELTLNRGQKQPAPDGKVKVRINLGNKLSNKRTILPDTSTYEDVYNDPDPSTFPGFLLFVYNDDTPGFELTPSGTSISSNPITPTLNYIDYAALSTEIDLTPSKHYTFTIFALSAKNVTGKYVAWGISDNGSGGSSIQVIGDGSDVINITLKEIIGDYSGTWDSNTGYGYISDGEFSWDVPITTQEIANLTLAPYDDQDNPIVTEDLTINSTGTEPGLTPGYYLMVLQLGETHYQTIFIREIVHIWSGLESIYAPVTLPALRSTYHPITFNYNDAGNTNNFALSVNHGDPIGSLSNPTKNTDPTRYLFKGWYYESGFTTAVVSTDKVLKPLNVYAKWNQVPLVGDYTFDHKNQTYGNTIVDVTVTLISSGSPGDVTVKYDGVTTLPTNAGTYAVTFDVDDDTGWEPATGLSAGNLVIAQGTPANGHFYLVHNKATVGNYTGGSSSIGQISGKSNGTRSNIQYEGTNGTNYSKKTAIPSIAGEFIVTFDIAESSDHNWEATNGLTAGTLTLVEPKSFEIALEWNNGGYPTLAFNMGTSKVTYDTQTGVVAIHIEVTTPEFADCNFDWQIDFDHNIILHSGNVLDDDTTIELIPGVNDDDWLVPGGYTFTVIVSGGTNGYPVLSGTVTLTVQ